MAEIALPLIVTAIANSELEGFVAGTLFSQGWNVIHRALDAASLESYLQQNADVKENIILVFSPDLSGLTPRLIASYQGILRQVVGFSASANGATENKLEDKLGDKSEYQGMFPTPHDATELLNIIRSFLRAPLLRATAPQGSRVRRAKVIALGTPSGSTGCTTVAINLAMELSLLGRHTLLLDADVRRPSVATLLSQHKLDADSETRTIAPHLSLSEFTQSRVHQLPDFLDQFTESFDFVIVDLGSIERVSDSLTDRRWTSTLIHWSCESADELWILGRADALGIHRMSTLAKDFEKITIRAKVSVLLSVRTSGKRGDEREASFMSAVAPLHPHRTFMLPRDNRSTSKAEDERAFLVEIGEKGLLRKAIAKIAVDLTT